MASADQRTFIGSTIHASLRIQTDGPGYTGYFGDPDGYRWEIAYNPGPIGQMVLPD